MAATDDEAVESGDGRDQAWTSHGRGKIEDAIMLGSSVLVVLAEYPNNEIQKTVNYAHAKEIYREAWRQG